MQAHSPASASQATFETRNPDPVPTAKDLRTRQRSTSLADIQRARDRPAHLSNNFLSALEAPATPDPCGPTPRVGGLASPLHVA